MNWNWLRLALLKKTIKRMVCNALAVFDTIAIYNTNATWINFNHPVIKIQTNTNLDC